MVRYAFFLALVVGSAATAIAAISPPQEARTGNITVIEKNQVFPIYGPIVVESCAKEDCSDVV
jgi:adenylylsulfate kinase-like enzyme